MPLNILSEVDDRDYKINEVLGTLDYELPDEYINPQHEKFLMQMTSYQCVAHSLATTMAYGERKQGLIPNDYSRG
jgi:hypothetical protein